MYFAENCALCRAMRLLRGSWPRFNPRLCNQGAIINCGTFTCAGSGLAASGDRRLRGGPRCMTQTLMSECLDWIASTAEELCGRSASEALPLGNK